MGIPPRLPASYAKGYTICDFLHAYLDDENLPKSLTERICSCRTKFFPERVDFNLRRLRKCIHSLLSTTVSWKISSELVCCYINPRLKYGMTTMKRHSPPIHPRYREKPTHIHTRVRARAHTHTQREKNNKIRTYKKMVIHVYRIIVWDLGLWDFGFYLNSLQTLQQFSDIPNRHVNL